MVLGACSSVGQGGGGNGGGPAAGSSGAPGGTGGSAGSGGAPVAGLGGTGGASLGGAGSGAAAGASAGASGAAGSGAGGGSSGAAGGGGATKALVSDDFESAAVGGPPDPARWTLSTVGGTGMIAIHDMGRNSARSLRVNGTNQFHTMAMLRGAPLFPAPGNKIGARVYIRLAQAMPSGHVTWLEAGAAMNDVAETRIGANTGALDINRWPGDTEQRAPGKVLTAGTWHCLEFLFDGTLHDARVWLDSAELTDLHVTDWVAPMQQNGNNTTPIPNWAPAYEAIRLGWELGGAEVWFDDVAFGHDRIGCL